MSIELMLSLIAHFSNNKKLDHKYYGYSYKLIDKDNCRADKGDIVIYEFYLDRVKVELREKDFIKFIYLKYSDFSFCERKIINKILTRLDTLTTIQNGYFKQISYSLLDILENRAIYIDNTFYVENKG